LIETSTIVVESIPHALTQNSASPRRLPFVVSL
jgi:hypothetical protein